VLVQHRVAIAIPVLPPDVATDRRDDEKQSPGHTMVVHLVSAGWIARSAFHQQLWRCFRFRTSSRVSDGVGDINCFRPRANIRCVSGSIRTALWRADLTAQDVVAARPGQNVQSRSRNHLARRLCQRRGLHFNTPFSTQGRLTDEKQFGDIIIKTGATVRSRGCATSRGLSRLLVITRVTAG